MPTTPVLITIQKYFILQLIAKTAVNKINDSGQKGLCLPFFINGSYHNPVKVVDRYRWCNVLSKSRML